MNELLELQKRGYYISLTFMPSGSFSTYVSRWDIDIDDPVDYADTIEDAMAIIKRRAEEYK